MMNLNNKDIKKIKKLAFKAILPFLPFILVIIGLVLAICTVVDTVFTTDEDMDVMAKLYTNDYEAQYAEWLKEKENCPNSILANGKELIPTRYVYMANTSVIQQ
ncbi:MAG: hypothetical protein HFJ52_01765 [Clostridia bacterium]|nr:hypothetical protein [Clostridia bacterium]